MQSSRRVLEGGVTQGADERVPYEFDFAAWGTPSSATVKLYKTDTATFTDVSTTCLSGSATIAGTVVTTPLVIGLTAGSRYRLIVLTTIGTALMSAFCDIATEPV